jgi:serine/threonine protein kinase
MSDSDNSLQPGSTFGKHRIVRLLGRGGMGEVYEVEHELTGKRHALKLLSGEVMEVSGALERFEREAKVMARLEHRGIVRVDDSGDTAGRHWLRMELMPGRDVEGKRLITLEEYVEAKGGRLPETEVKKLTEEILEALGHAHGQGLVHRDLKPANVLLDGERLKIADFGLVNAAGAEWMDTQVRSTVINQDEEDTLIDDGSGTGSRSRAIMGTYAYMSPEQRDGLPADARSDLYAVGLMVFRMLTGLKTPGFKLPSRIIKDIDPGWDDWVERCMEEKPTDRFPNAGEMKDALSFKEGTVPPATGAKPTPQPFPESNELPGPNPVAKPQAPVRKAPTEVLASNAKAESEMKGMVSRFKKRLAEMRQSEMSGGKSLQIYLEEQNDVREFRKGFKGLGKSLSAEIMMELQKAEILIEKRIIKLRMGTKRLWVFGVFAFVLLAAGSVTGLWWLSGFWDARSAAEKIATDALTPTQQWEKLSAYSESYGNYLQDEEVREFLDQAIVKAFDGAGTNLVQESQDEFLLKTQDKGLDFLPRADVERKRAQVVAMMCDRVLDKMKLDGFDVKDGKDFLELFEDPPRIRTDEKGNPLPLINVDFHRFQENDAVFDKLLKIAAALARMEDTNDRMKERFDSLKQKIDRFDKEVLIAWKKFRDTGEVDHGILAQESYLDGLDYETREFSGSEAVDPNDYREVRDALRDLRMTWISFSKEVESTR